MINSNDIRWEIIAEAEDLPVRGNAMFSDDPAFDKECEDEILARLDQGDVWAWAYVRVRGTYKGILSAEASLGACNYANEAEFMADEAYLGALKMEVIDALNKQMATLLGSEDGDREDTRALRSLDIEHRDALIRLSVGERR